MNDVTPEDTTSGAPKRRRRRRSRRPSGHDRQNSSSQTPSGETPKNEPSTSTAPQRRKRSRRRGGANKNSATSSTTSTSITSTSTQPQEAPAESGRSGRRKANSQRRRGTNRNQSRPQKRVPQAAQQSRMETSNETSAGGLVVSGLAESVDDNGHVDLARVYVALIGRLDRRGRLLWSMPKGHVEAGEEKSATAEREVWEETGIHGEVFADLGVIDYWFVSEGKRIHKTVHHHLLRYVDGDLNDEDPEVTEVSWIPANQLIEHLAFADERKLARQAHNLLPEFARREKAEGRATPR